MVLTMFGRGNIYLAKLYTSKQGDGDEDAKDTLTNLVKTQNYEGNKIILPHPSPRNNIWLKKNEWYINDVLPQLKARVKDILDGSKLRIY